MLARCAVSSQANDFGTPGVAEHCYRIDSRRQADAFNGEVRIRMLQSLAQDAELSIAIGATGVELAAELVQLVHSAVAYGAEDLASRMSVTLVEAGPRLLDAFPEDISRATRTRLEAIGIKVMTGARVTAADADGFTLTDGSRVAASLRVWAAGVKAADFLAGLAGLDTTRSNQLVVEPTLQTTRDPAIYALGDCASLTLPGGARPLPPTAQVAHQQAKYRSGRCRRRCAAKRSATSPTETWGRWSHWPSTAPTARSASSGCSTASPSEAAWRSSATSCSIAATRRGSTASRPPNSPLRNPAIIFPKNESYRGKLNVTQETPRAASVWRVAP